MMFHETMMGRVFFEGTMPRIASALQDIASSLKAQNQPKSIQADSSDAAELVGTILDSFEDFLQEKGVAIANDEKADDVDAAILYGTDYAVLEERVKDTLVKWGVFSGETT